MSRSTVSVPVTPSHLERAKSYEQLWGDSYCPVTMALIQDGHTDVKVGRSTALFDDSAWVMSAETEQWVRSWDAGEASQGMTAEFTQLPHATADRVLSVVI